MRKTVKKLNLLFLISLFFASVYGNTKQSSQLIQSGHWIYDDLTLLESESGVTMFLESQPMSISEIKFYLKNIDYDKLSDSGKFVFDKVNNYINDEDDFIKADGARLFLNARVNPEFYYKSNDDIDLSFKRYFKDYPITIPIVLGFSDYLTIQSDLFIGKNPVAVAQSHYFTNIPLGGGEIEFSLPKFAYLSGAASFDKWGFAAHIGKEGLNIGNTSLNSIVYSDSFETDFYTQLSLYNKYVKFNINVTQVDNTKYYYTHHLTLHPFKRFNVGVIEGSLLNAPFELRYLNPLIIMHQFGSWYDYDNYPNLETGEIYDKYGEGRFCAFLGLSFEWIPINNLRIYGLYAQNEILDLGGSREPHALSVPDSIGGQLGAEYFIPMKNQAYLKTGIEAVYTSPYLYVKHSPDWSLYRNRDKMMADSVHSWLGSPFGPDSFAVQAKVKYETNKKWSVGTELLFAMHGENTAVNLFDEKNHKIYIDIPVKDSQGNVIYKEIDENGKKIKVPVTKKVWYWNYYPSVQFEEAGTDSSKQDAAVNKGRYMWMTGTPEYKGQIAINGHYRILHNLDLTGQFVYSFIFNNNNQLDNFAQGVELSFAVSYELF